MSDTRPDVLGLDLDTARSRLTALGHRVVRVKSTSPPGRPAAEGPQRVARQRWTEEGVELVVVGEMKLHD
jgi:hypothetical protein